MATLDAVVIRPIAALSVDRATGVTTGDAQIVGTLAIFVPHTETAPARVAGLLSRERLIITLLDRRYGLACPVQQQRREQAPTN